MDFRLFPGRKNNKMANPKSSEIDQGKLANSHFLQIMYCFMPRSSKDSATRMNAIVAGYSRIAPDNCCECVVT